MPNVHLLETTVKFKLNHTKNETLTYQHLQNQERMISWQNLFSSGVVHEIHELLDLTMPVNHPTQLCQDKFTIKDVKSRISIIIWSRLKGVVKP